MRLLLFFIASPAVSICVATISLAAALPDIGEIRDIRTQLPPFILPPFSGSALLLLIAGIGVVVTATRRKGKYADVPCQIPPFAADSLALLRESYARGELPAALVCERLAGLIGARLVAGSVLTLTSNEIISAASATFPEDVVTAADTLLQLCDKVRFGAFNPDSTVIAPALAETELLLKRLPGAAA